MSIPVSFKNQLTLIAANAPRCSAAFYGCQRRQGERERRRRLAGLVHCLCARLLRIACELCRVFIASATLAHCIDDLQY